MKIVLPSKVQQILHTLHEGGYEAYIVGGCVRDSILGRKPEDWDITTSAKPSEVKRLFRRTVDTGIAHGTVTVLLGADGFEVTTYRIDGEYQDSRHPSEVRFTKSLAQDLERRDFTINAMAYDEGLVDLFCGMQDMEDRLIRAVGDPRERFGEDALRILRAVRFSAQLDYRIEEETEKAITELAGTLEKISAERIRTELQKLLLSDHPERLADCRRYGILSVVLHELEGEDDQTLQKICSCLRTAPKDVPIRLAILLHPVGEERGLGALKRLKYDNETIRQALVLIRAADEEIELSPAAVRRSIVRTGVDLMPKLFALKRSTGAGSRSYLDRYERIYEQVLQDGDCISIRDLSVNGNDLMREMNMKPGKELGETLQQLFEYVLEDPSCNEKSILLSRLKGTQESSS